MRNMVYNMHRESDDSLENLVNQIIKRVDTKVMGSDLVVNMFCQPSLGNFRRNRFRKYRKLKNMNKYWNFSQYSSRKLHFLSYIGIFFYLFFL